MAICHKMRIVATATSCINEPDVKAEQEENGFLEYFPDNGDEFQPNIDSWDEDKDYQYLGKDSNWSDNVD